MGTNHDGGSSHKKGWRAYFFEFFMLFLAVFCGSLSEYWLEHRIERDREKDYMKSEIADLKTDTLAFNNFLTLSNDKFKGYKEVVVTINRFLENKATAQALIEVNGKYCGSYISADINERTITQLKSSGGLRMILKQDASDAINQYYSVASNLIASQAEIMKNQQVKIMDLGTKIFDTSYNTDSVLYQNLKNKKIPFEQMMISQDPKLLKEYANNVQIQIGILDYHIAIIKSQKNAAIYTLNLLKKEYHL